MEATLMVPNELLRAPGSVGPCLAISSCLTLVLVVSYLSGGQTNALGAHANHARSPMVLVPLPSSRCDTSSIFSGVGLLQVL
jgi:hypothetical protein